jgi:LAO/AO transport system kinase
MQARLAATARRFDGRPAPTKMPPMQDLARRVIEGDLRAAARAMRLVDDRARGHVELLKTLWKRPARAFVVGITGTPGAGKSTLVDKLVSAWRKDDAKVGVVAVDPTSPFTGGSILGDRIRMQRHFLDEKVFIRSIATRGAMGGLSRSAGDVVRVMDAWGCDVILLETVGVGQDELEVTKVAHTTVVVVTPGGGDEIQANKAGTLEVADVFAVNKADREGADAQVRHLEGMIALGNEIARGIAARPAGHSHAAHGAHAAFGSGAAGAQPDGGWTPPILKTVAAKNEGIAELRAAVEQHRAWTTSELGLLRQRRHANERLIALFRDILTEAAMTELAPDMERAAHAVEDGASDPYSACEALLAKFRAR